MLLPSLENNLIFRIAIKAAAFLFTFVRSLANDEIMENINCAGFGMISVCVCARDES